MSSTLDLREGATFAGQFRVVRPLKKGGMGAVYVVEQAATKRERALKLMHPMLVADERSRDRFEREAQVSARIDSDHVVEVIAAGVEPSTGTPWLCMELLKGEELGDRMARGPLSPGETLEIVRQLGHALGAAHKAGIVHRDLKPENLFLAVPRREGVPFTLKVLDFGVAALVHDASGKSSATQGVGSPLWMAPEQTNVGNVQPATDVWALGLLAYHFLTGRLYWRSATIEGSTLSALLVEVMIEDLPPASVRAGEQGCADRLPRGFDAWFSRCVARDPNQRFAEAGAALAELTAILMGQTPSMAPSTQPQAFAATMAAPPTAPFGGTTGSPAQAPATARHEAPVVASAAPVAPAARRRVWPWVLLAMFGGALFCGVGVVYFLVRGAQAVAETARTLPEIDIPGDDGESIHIGPGGATVTLPDGGVVIRIGTDRPSSLGEPGDDVEIVVNTPTGNVRVDGDGTTPVEGVPPVEPTEATEPTVEPTGSEETPRRTRPRESATARRLRAHLARCISGNLVGSPPERWTFTLSLGPNDRANNVVIRGPTGGAASSFRACVVSTIQGYESGGDPGPFTLMLP